MTSPLDYVALGWHIFPCHTIVRGVCSCTKGPNCPSPGKHPRTINGVKDASINPEVINAWQQRFAPTNWAVACGTQSGIVVIDVDPRKNGFASIEELEMNRHDGPLPETLTSLTGGAGKHLIYTYPGGVPIANRNNWLSGVDVKSDGGYIVLPEAEHISGGTYRWANWNARIEPLPVDILQMLVQSASGGAGNSDLPDTSTILQGVPEGERDQTLFKFACRLRRQFNNDEGARRIVELAILDAAANCDPPFPADEALKKVAQAYKQDHNDEMVDWAFGDGSADDDALGLTDVGNSRRFVRRHGSTFRHVEGWGWLSWTDIGWRRGADSYAIQKACDISEMILEEGRRETDQQVQKRFARWAKDSENYSRVKATVSLAEVQPSMSLRPTDFDAEDVMLNCRNGIVNLRTGATRLIDQNDLVTKNTNVVYDPEFRLQLWEDFLDVATQGDQELKNYLQLAAGYTLTGSNSEECFFIISGPQASGKSTFLDALHSALGDYASTSPAETITYQRHKTFPEQELARLAGMRLVSISEIREGASFDETLVKSITGGDRISGRFLYKTAFEYRPQFKLWIATNHDPDARDDAIWRRLKKVPFKHSIDKHKRDPRVKAVLQDKEVGGKAVLAWAVRGAMKWYSDGLHEPDTVKMEVRAYHAEQDRTQHFITDCLNAAPGGRVTLRELHGAYVQWCRYAGETAKNETRFKKSLETRGLKTVPDDRGRPLFVDIALRTMNQTMTGVQWT